MLVGVTFIAGRSSHLIGDTEMKHPHDWACHQVLYFQEGAIVSYASYTPKTEFLLYSIMPVLATCPPVKKNYCTSSSINRLVRSLPRPLPLLLVFFPPRALASCPTTSLAASPS